MPFGEREKFSRLIVVSLAFNPHIIIHAITDVDDCYLGINFIV